LILISKNSTNSASSAPSPLQCHIDRHQSRRVLDEFVREQARHIYIIANDAYISEDGSEWKVVWKDNTALERDKASSIQEA
jgi:hypothetical protein